MTFKISVLNNGWCLEMNNGEDGWVVSEDGSAVQAFAKFLRIIENECGPDTSRYSKERIYISVLPGDKCEEEPTTEMIETVNWYSSIVGQDNEQK